MRARRWQTPSVVELTVIAPQATGQPQLDGKILLLPLRDDHGRISRMLGLLVMSGRRGEGGRRFVLSGTTEPRVSPIVGLRPIEGGKAIKLAGARPNLRLRDTDKAGDMPALRLVVSNSSV